MDKICTFRIVCIAVRDAFLECQNQLLLAVSKMQNEASNFRCYVVPLFNWISKFAQAIMKT